MTQKCIDNMNMAVTQVYHLSWGWALLSLSSIADAFLPSESAQAGYRANADQFGSTISSSITTPLDCCGAQMLTS